MPWRAQGRHIQKKTSGRWRNIAKGKTASSARASVRARYAGYKRKQRKG